MTDCSAPRSQTFSTGQHVKKSGKGDSPMGAEFDGKKIVVVGGSAGMGRQAALDVIDRGGSAVIIGRSKGLETKGAISVLGADMAVQPREGAEIRES
jgi:hypothetical protein